MYLHLVHEVAELTRDVEDLSAVDAGEYFRNLLWKITPALHSHSGSQWRGRAILDGLPVENAYLLRDAKVFRESDSWSTTTLQAALR